MGNEVYLEAPELRQGRYELLDGPRKRGRSARLRPPERHRVEHPSTIREVRRGFLWHRLPGLSKRRLRTNPAVPQAGEGVALARRGSVQRRVRRPL